MNFVSVWVDPNKNRTSAQDISNRRFIHMTIDVSATEQNLLNYADSLSAI